ncbi:MAG: hypothetical protein WD181_04220 [Solirubrobacterales bacterium]
MDTVDQLLAEYAEAFKSGQTDPWPFLDQVEGAEREELDRRMEKFLLEVEPARWDRAAYESSPAFELVERLVPELLVPEQGWRDLLPSMRLRLRMKRETVFAELAKALDARGAIEEEKVADYYNDMEQGNLDPQGVSDRVLDALSGIYGTTVEVLRKVGEATPKPKAGGSVFARSEDTHLKFSSQQYFGLADFPEGSPTPSFNRIKGKPDRIDRLFVDVDQSGAGR